MKGLIIILLASVALFGCLENNTNSKSDAEVNEEGQIVQGEVVYSVEFPYINDPTLIKWFPTEYTTKFNKNEIYGEMNSRMNVITNRFYSNQEAFELKQTLENMSGNYLSELTAEDVNSMVNQMPDMIISEPHGDTSIVGLKCKIAFAEFKIDSVPPVILYYTEEIKVNSPNWFNQFRGFDKFLLGYEIEQFGMRMKLMAKELKKGEPDIRLEQIYASKEKEAYTSLSGSELKSTFNQMLVDFMQ
ncbi:MAG: hypothetical protein AB8B53_11070 [Flavobacteriales bacterium]